MNRYKRDILEYLSRYIVQSVLVYKLTEQDKALNLDEDYLSRQNQGVIGKAKWVNVKRHTKDQRHLCTVSLRSLLSQETKHHVTQKRHKAIH